MKRTVFIILGSFFVGLGALGVFIPVLPTTPFLLLAAYFYANSSDRLYRWILNSPLLGDYIRHYREGGGVSVVKKVLVILFLWITLGYTALVVVNPWWGKTLLLFVAAGITWHIIRIKTARVAALPGAALKPAETIGKD